MDNNVTIIEALENALELIESCGYKSGDMHDDLYLAITRLKTKHPQVCKEGLVQAGGCYFHRDAPISTCRDCQGGGE